MNVMRRGLLMILIAGLVFPAPAALAVNAPSDNTESSAAEHAAAHPETAAESAVVKPDATSVAQAQPVATAESDPPTTPPVAPETSPAPAAPASVAQTAAPQADADALTPPSAQAAAADSSTIPPPKVLISKVKIGPGAEEFVELYNTGNEAVNLKGWRLQFLKEGFTGGIREQTRILKDFGDAALKPGEFYAVRHSKNEALSEIREVFDDSYKSGSLAANGSVRLVTAAGEAADLIGWNKAAAFEKFAAKIDSKKQNVLQRCIGANVVRDSDNNADDFTAGNEFSLGQFINCAAPEPPNPPQPSQPSDPSSPPDNPHEPAVPPNACANIKLTEIGANLDDQFIEIYNAGDTVANLNGCKLTTSNNKKQYGFGDSELAAHDFLTVNVKEAGLKLGKTTGTVRILNSSGETVDEIHYEKLPKNTSWSLVDDDWTATYAFTPGRGNVAELWLPCPVGKIRNELTGKCVKEKQTPVERELQPCQPWQYRNPETGRCKNYAKVATVKPCKDGQYRSEETGRCRKKKSESVKLTSYPVESDTAAASSYAMWWAVGGITAAGSGYAGWEWRREITRLFRRIRLPWQK